MRPFTRGHIFRLPFGCSPIQVKELLLQSLEGVPGVLTEPAPLVLVLNQTDAWVQFKLIYYIRDFGTQYRIGDTVITKALEILRVFFEGELDGAGWALGRNGHLDPEFGCVGVGDPLF